MDFFKSLKCKILHGSLARRVILRAFMIASALSVVPFLHILSGSDPVLFAGVSSSDCTVITGYLNPHLFLHRLIYPILDSLEPQQCMENVNLTVNTARELMGMRMLSEDAKVLCVGEGSASSAFALRELGFANVYGVYRHPFFSLKHKKFVYELDYEENSFGFVFSRDLDKVSVPALLVLEIERVLSPGGIGAMLVDGSSSPNSLIRSATPVSSILKTSSIVHVGHLNEYTLVVFKKKIETVTYLEQFRLPADCSSLVNNKPFMEFIEPLVEEKPMGFEEKITYLPKFIDAASKKRLVYIDIGAAEHLNANVTNWFMPSYPVDHKAFNVYFVDHNTSILLSYVKRPGITFVYHPDLAGSKAVATLDVSDDLDPSVVAEEGFDFLLWFKETVQYADFVVLKMNVGEEELKFLLELFKSGTICFVDELFLRCRSGLEGKGAVSGSCMDIFKSLRSSGMFVHQWWED
ncbi:hypothetical protein Ddye_011088 [Dipteronia dyeriana]|uniref:DUF7870 domain-containing protein n=1 Tax=Dipteronia dyeriana TaxID=168575 RepID=A0AAD9XEH6_9ROSI|nr:hypothetical protein Ddye_011088 [Dipteronia dyeriana]